MTPYTTKSGVQIGRCYVPPRDENYASAVIHYKPQTRLQRFMRSDWAIPCIGFVLVLLGAICGVWR